MDRISCFEFTIEGNDLDPIAVKKEIGLPCEIYYKGKVSFKSNLTGKDVVSCSTQWLYAAESRRSAKTETFLIKQLEIILQKMPLLKKYIKKYNSYIEITIYEDDFQDENLLLTKKLIKLFNEIDVGIFISFVNITAIYGDELIAKAAKRIRQKEKRNKDTN